MTALYLSAIVKYALHRVHVDPLAKHLQPGPGMSAWITLGVVTIHVLALYVLICVYARGGVGPKVIDVWFPIIESGFGIYAALVVSDLFTIKTASSRK